MSHSYALHEQVKAMLATKYFMPSPEVRELESDTIIVQFDIQIRTNDEQRNLPVTMQFRCVKSGIVSRAILQTKTPFHMYQRVVDLITQINSSRSFSCLEFDYRDGEISARNFLQCMDYVPSIETIYTMIYDANSMFMEHGDRIIEAMGTLPDAAERSRASEAAMHNGKTGQQNPRAGKVDMPPVYSRDELYSVSQARARAFLNNEYADASAEERDWFIEQVNQMDAALSGDISACSTLAHVFSDTAYPGLADPKLAYQWYGWGYNQTDESNWSAFRGMPGANLDGVLRMFKFFMAKNLVLFGDTAEKQLARDIMIEYIDIYRGYRYLATLSCMLISTLCGVPADKVFRTGKYDISCVVNKELAIQYYKQMIDDEVADGNSDAAKSYAEEFESILGITYYKDKVGASSSYSPASNTAKGGCYIATCVYGSYDCPQVWTLRRYRDTFLSESTIGRAFIKVYYAVSPHLVRCFGNCKLFRNVWKKLLDSMITTLKTKGYSDSPYED